MDLSFCVGLSSLNIEDKLIRIICTFFWYVLIDHFQATKYLKQMLFLSFSPAAKSAFCFWPPEEPGILTSI